MKIPEHERAEGRTPCSKCGRAYSRHPEAVFGELVLNKICTGAWPRTGRPDVHWVKL